MRRSLQILFLVFLFVGCKHEESNPELLDRIYSDLVTQMADNVAKLGAEQKTLNGAKNDLENADPNTIDERKAQRQIARSTKIIEGLEQKIHYEKIRTGRRLAEDHINYHKAFAAGKEWPDKAEYDQYVINQRLLNAPLNWDAHLPKLFDRKPAAALEKKTPPASSPSGE